MSLAATEFIRRMLLHVLPLGFHRIRYYGFLANRARQRKLAECRRALHTPPPAEQAGPVTTDYRDRYEAVTGRSLAAVSPVPRREHAHRRSLRRRLGASGHPGLVVMSPSKSARRRLPLIPERRDGRLASPTPPAGCGRGPPYASSPTAVSRQRPRTTRSPHASSVSRPCNAHSRASGQRFRPIHLSVSGAVTRPATVGRWSLDVALEDDEGVARGEDQLVERRVGSVARAWVPVVRAWRRRHDPTGTGRLSDVSATSRAPETVTVGRGDPADVDVQR